MAEGAPARGAYGLEIDLVGAPDTPGLLDVPAGGDATGPVTRIVVEHVVDPDHAPVDEPVLSAQETHYPFFLGGRLDMVRAEHRATVTTPGPLAASDLVHPYLSPIGGMWARWLGREPFHCSAAVLDGRVWGILGPRESGKSTLVAWLATHDVPVMTDDLLVVDVVDGSPVAFAGPRSVDLRAPTAELLRTRLGDDVDLALVRERERWRLPVGDVPWSLPMGGWFILDEGATASVERVDPARRLTVLADHRMVRLEVQDAVHWMDLAALPTHRLVRPKDFGQLDEVVATMHDCAARSFTVGE